MAVISTDGYTRAHRKDRRDEKEVRLKPPSKRSRYWDSMLNSDDACGGAGVDEGHGEEGDGKQAGVEVDGVDEIDDSVIDNTS